MKKLITLSLATLTTLSLVACSSSKSSSSNGDSRSTSSKVASTQNEKIAKRVSKEFNTDGEKVVTTKIETNVVDDQSKTNKNGDQVPHESIKILVTDKATKNKIKKDKAAIDNGSATYDQKMYILGIQETISNAAKKLNNKDTISFGYQEDSDNSVLVALSMKNKDVIQHVSI
ncbi:hypothetical protein [Levilactobacillus namurensis]|uniref:hypothetical protein n=1 Tax=Levilactobacillus namurensis TaxID=380393 RepID=UPI0004650A90|nr:hypothetical protein [Levilactobacillus namurensis]